MFNLLFCQVSFTILFEVMNLGLFTVRCTCACDHRDEKSGPTNDSVPDGGLISLDLYGNARLTLILARNSGLVHLNGSR